MQIEGKNKNDRRNGGKNRPNRRHRRPMCWDTHDGTSIACYMLLQVFITENLGPVNTATVTMSSASQMCLPQAVDTY